MCVCVFVCVYVCVMFALRAESSGVAGSEVTRSGVVGNKNVLSLSHL